MKKISIRLLFLLMLIGVFTTSSAQKSQPLRVEIEAKKVSANYMVAPLGKDGLIIFYESDENEKENKIWVFTKYNTNLKEDWSIEVPVQKSLNFMKYYYDDQKNMLYVLVGNSKGIDHSAPDASGAYHVISVDISKGAGNTVTSEFPKKVTIIDFKVINNKGSIFCQKFITTIDLEDGASTTIPIKYNENPFILSTELIQEKNPYYKVFIENKINKKTSKNYFNDFSESGDLLKSSAIEPGPDKLLNTFKYHGIGKDESVIIGTYVSKKKKAITYTPSINVYKGMMSSSVGIYFTKLKGDEQEYIKFYPFVKMENFLNS